MKNRTLTYRIDSNGKKVLIEDSATEKKTGEVLQNELFGTSLTKSEKPVYESMYSAKERAYDQYVYEKASSKIDDIHKYDIYTNIARVARVALIATGLYLTTKAAIHGQHLIEATGDITNDNSLQTFLYGMGTAVSGVASSYLVNKFREKTVQAKHFASKCIDYLGGVKDSVIETIENRRQEAQKDAEIIDKFNKTNADITQGYNEQTQTSHIDDIIDILNKNNSDSTIAIDDNKLKDLYSDEKGI